MFYTFTKMAYTLICNLWPAFTLVMFLKQPQKWLIFSSIAHDRIDQPGSEWCSTLHSGIVEQYCPIAFMPQNAHCICNLEWHGVITSSLWTNRGITLNSENNYKRFPNDTSGPSSQNSHQFIISIRTLHTLCMFLSWKRSTHISFMKFKVKKWHGNCRTGFLL